MSAAKGHSEVCPRLLSKDLHLVPARWRLWRGPPRRVSGGCPPAAGGLCWQCEPRHVKW